MSTSLIVTRSIDAEFNDTGEQIELSEWLQWVAGEPRLRIRSESTVVTNPKAGAVISIPAMPGQTEFEVNGNFVPFLGYRAGELIMKFTPDMKLPSNPLRLKIGEIARKLGALIKHDAGDEILKW